jgi:hypothetical protein
VKRVEYTDDHVLVEVETKVGMMRFPSILQYRLLLASSGKQQLHLESKFQNTEQYV